MNCKAFPDLTSSSANRSRLHLFMLELRLCKCKHTCTHTYVQRKWLENCLHMIYSACTSSLILISPWSPIVTDAFSWHLLWYSKACMMVVLGKGGEMEVSRERLSHSLKCPKTIQLVPKLYHTPEDKLSFCHWFVHPALHGPQIPWDKSKRWTLIWLSHFPFQ